MPSLANPTAKQTISEDFARNLAYKIMRIVRTKAQAGDLSAQATIEEAMRA